MKTPQIILLAIMGIGLLITAHDHGKPRKPNNFWIYLLATVITLSLLILGGFFE